MVYEEKKISKGVFVRNFGSDTDSEELVWHRDAEDRLILPIGYNDWQLQMDNELPKKINGLIFIPKETYHRVLKGASDLKILLIKM